ncbi:MAG: type II toxin-antitoxin system HicB family antitoxin, partial [Moorea sp. SIO3E2]|nr:type II toxin-antitoxin system HicB family antitoxin [Moorena sp. SIO3E2]
EHSYPIRVNYARTHGDTYEEALENAKEVLEDLVYAYSQVNKELPTPKILEVALN